MGRLIDADELLRRWDELPNRSRIEFDQVIMLMPIAYDVDKVVKQLEKLKKQNPFINGIRDNSIEAAASRQTLDYAIDIIKKGGIDEKVNS